MSIWLTGDLHGASGLDRLMPWTWPEGRELDKSDFLVVLGDFGLVWHDDRRDDFALDALDDLPWTTLFVDGNHENHAALATYPRTEMFGGTVGVLRPSVFHLLRSQVLDIPMDGDTTLSCAVMGGARSIDRAWRTEGVSWWPQEIPSQEERDAFEAALKARDWRVDCVLTHDSPANVVPALALMSRLDDVRADDTERWLGSIEYRLDYRLWCFGHWHLDATLDNRTNVLYRSIENVIDLLGTADESRTR